MNTFISFCEGTLCLYTFLCWSRSLPSCPVLWFCDLTTDMHLLCWDCFCSTAGFPETLLCVKPKQNNYRGSNKTYENNKQNIILLLLHYFVIDFLKLGVVLMQTFAINRKSSPNTCNLIVSSAGNYCTNQSRVLEAFMQ